MGFQQSDYRSDESEYDAQTVTISAKELSITDNSVMTDWLSGKTYVVAGGNVTFTVPAKWGAVLIAGNIELGSFRDEYEVKDTGSVSAQGSTVKDSNGAFTLKGSGSIGGTSDHFQYASLPAFNNFSVITKINSIESGSANAKAGIMIRNSSEANSKYYALFAKQSGGFGYSYRDAVGGTATESFSGTTSYPTWLKVERVNNVFKAYTAPDAGGSPGAWSLINGSEKHIQMDTEVLHGLAVTSSDTSLKQAQFTGMAKTDLGKQKFDDFAGAVPGSMFTILNPDTSKISLSGGKLNMTTTNSNKNLVVASAPAGQDWSAKVKVSFTPTVNGQEANLLAYQDSKNIVKVNRIRDGGVTKLGFASVINGHQQYNSLITDPNPGSDIYLQLQRIGSRYTAVYSVDGNNWSDLGTSEFANFSQTLVGMTAIAADSSSATAGFDYFSFGNTIAGESSYNSSVSEGKYDLSLGVDPTTPWGRLVFGDGDWDYTEGGYSQTNLGYNKNMNFADRPYEDFYMEASLKFNAATGWGGISFRRTNETDSYSASGYLLYLLADGRISLHKNRFQEYQYNAY
jgi:regulation of enolase protein 1 (concanavalin A-like superfamily)